MKITPTGKAGAMMAASGTFNTPKPVIKMNTNTRSAGNSWVEKHKPQSPHNPAPNSAASQGIPPQPSAANAPIQAAPPTAQPSPVADPTKSPAVEAPSPALSPQFASLARMQKQLRNAQQQFKAQQDAWKQEQANYISKSTLESDPLKTLADAGLSYDKLTELQLNQPAIDPSQPLLDKIAALEARLASVDEQFNTRDKQAYDQAVATIRRDADLLIASDPTYETIRATGSAGDVVKLIQAVFEEENDILSVEEAAALVEDELVERKVDEITRLSKLAKLSKRLAPAQPVQSAAPASAPVEEGAPPKRSNTLTNADGSARPLSPVERAIENYRLGLQGKR